MSESNPWLDRRVIVYAHQGGALEGPSTTLFAMDKALAGGADAIELDVHQTKDGHLVCCHDATVDRTTNGFGKIGDLSLDEVRAFNNAYWFSPGHVANHGLEPNEYPYRSISDDDILFKVPLLEEVLERYQGRILNFDIKETSPAVPEYETALAKTLMKFGRAEDVIVTSFLDSAVQHFRQVAPEVHTSCATLEVANFYRSVRDGEDPEAPAAVALQVPPSFQGVSLVDERFVAVAHSIGLAVHVWTIDDEEEMKRMLAIGVDGIISDVPSIAVRVVSEAGLRMGTDRSSPTVE